MAHGRLQTAITRMFGIRHPILQGGLNYASSAELSAAVANAGGLGFVSALAQPSGSALRDEIRAARAMLLNDDGPDCPGALGVNLTMLPSSPDQEEKSYDEFVEAIIDEGITVVETSALLPSSSCRQSKRSSRHRPPPPPPSVGSTPPPPPPRR